MEGVGGGAAGQQRQPSPAQDSHFHFPDPPTHHHHHPRPPGPLNHAVASLRGAGILTGGQTDSAWSQSKGRGIPAHTAPNNEQG